MKASEIMSSPAISVDETATLEQAARVMIDHRVGGLPVVDARGLLVGFLTESDLGGKERGVPFSLITAPQVLGQWIGNEGIERIYQAARSIHVGEVMSRPAITATEDDSVETIVRNMTKHDINRIVVVRGRLPVGIVARHDLLRLLLDPPATGRRAAASAPR